jgi:2,3-bisphosphoglycerate-independent phosphoglycerate mutase
MIYKKTILIILDGVGISETEENNALALAKTPNLDSYFFENKICTKIEASGEAVGLPKNQMGNSEVGHTIIGCGSVLRQDLVHIRNLIEDKSFFNNGTLLNAIRRAKQNNRPVHLLGLVSDGGVHSHIDHLFALIELCQQLEVVPYLHMVTDGRDTAKQVAKTDLQRVLSHLDKANGKIVSIIGRYYAMDRDKRWERTQKAWEAIALAKGAKENTPKDVIENNYKKGITDEFIEPAVLPSAVPLDHEDTIIFFNFRNDRPRQLAHALTNKKFNHFDRGNAPVIRLASMTQFDRELECDIAFSHMLPKVTLPEIISWHDLNQFHCAETEKYPHVTFFFNGGRERPLPGEDRIMVPSPAVSTYDMQPEMSCVEVGEKVTGAIKNKKYSFVVVNFANGDMVGHTANPKAIISSLETLDKTIGKITEAAKAHDYSVIITADHGNCEQMVDPETGEPHPMHTTNPVPFAIIDDRVEKLLSGGGLSNVAPSVLSIMGLPHNPAMDRSLVVFKRIN